MLIQLIAQNARSNNRAFHPLFMHTFTIIISITKIGVKIIYSPAEPGGWRGGASPTLSLIFFFDFQQKLDLLYYFSYSNPNRNRHLAQQFQVRAFSPEILGSIPALVIASFLNKASIKNISIWVRRESNPGSLLKRHYHTLL